MGLKKGGAKTAHTSRAGKVSKPTMQSGLRPRLLAAALTDAVLRAGRSLDDAQRDVFAKPEARDLDHRDRALARAIATATIRYAGPLQRVIDNFLERPLPKNTGMLKAVLLCTSAQLLILKTPAHAAISLAVEQVRRDHRARRFDKLVNAVTRRVAKKGPQIFAELDTTRLAVPDWMLARWEKTYGADLARNIAAASLTEADLDLTVMGSAQDWAQRLDGKALATGSVRLASGGRIEAIQGFEDGKWWVQDAGAAMPARLLGDIKDARVLDMCAAPGGKTAQLAAAGFDVTALDISETRMERVRENLERLKLKAELIVADAAEFSPPEPFDAVLLDAPCTATGTIRRHPDIVHLKKPSDIDALRVLQSLLLDRARALTKPSGTIVYCTCSLEPEEGAEQIEAALNRWDDLHRSQVTASELGCPETWISDTGDLRTLPCHDFGLESGVNGLDGFFAARLVRAPARR